MWVNLTSSSNARFGVIGTGSPGGGGLGNRGWLIACDYRFGPNILIRIKDGADGANASIFATGDIRNTGWRHLAVTFDRDGVATVYLDGVNIRTGSIASESGSLVDDVNADLLIGRDTRNAGNEWVGGIDEVQVFDRLLTGGEVLDIFGAGADGVCKASSPCGPPTCTDEPADAAAWWPGDCDAADLVSGDLGVLHDNAAAGVAGQVDGAFGFDGAGDFVETQYTDTFLGDFTVAAWVRLPGGVGDGPFAILGKGKPEAGLPNNVGWLVGVDYRSGKFELRAKIGDGTTATGQFFTPSSNPVELRDNTWHHLVAVFDRTSPGRLYLDGAQTLTNATGVGANTGSLGASAVAIGRQGDQGVYWPGEVDEVMIFNRQLSLVEINGIYTAGELGVCKPCTPCQELFEAASDAICGGAVPTSYPELRSQIITAATAQLAACNTLVCADQPGGGDCLQFISDALDTLLP